MSLIKSLLFTLLLAAAAVQASTRQDRKAGSPLVPPQQRQAG